jgi:hypothetical protein
MGVQVHALSKVRSCQKLRSRGPGDHEPHGLRRNSLLSSLIVNMHVYSFNYLSIISPSFHQLRQAPIPLHVPESSPKTRPSSPNHLLESSQLARPLIGLDLAKKLSRSAEPTVAANPARKGNFDSHPHLVHQTDQKDVRSSSVSPFPICNASRAFGRGLHAAGTNMRS